MFTVFAPLPSACEPITISLPIPFADAMAWFPIYKELKPVVNWLLNAP